MKTRSQLRTIKPVKRKKPPKVYKLKSCSYTIEERNCITRLSLAARDLNWKRNSFFTLLKAAKYDIPERTLLSWETAYKSHESVSSSTKHSGAAPALSPSEEQITVGFISHSRFGNQIVHRKTVTDFIKSKFQKDLSLHWASVFLNSNGFSNKRTRSSQAGFTRTATELKEIALNYIKNLRKDGLLERSRSEMCSIDFTFTSHRTASEHTFAARGRYDFCFFQ